MRIMNKIYSSKYVSLAMALWDLFNSVRPDTGEKFELVLENAVIASINLIMVIVSNVPLITDRVDRKTKTNDKYGDLKGMSKVHQFLKFQIFLSVFLLFVLWILDMKLIN